MALINCLECEKEVSDKAKECIGYGYPLVNDVVKDKIITEPESPSKINSIRL